MNKIIRIKHLVMIWLVASIFLGLVFGGSVAWGKPWEERTVEIVVWPMYNWYPEKTQLELLTTQIEIEMPTDWMYAYSAALFLMTHPDVKIDFETSQKQWGGYPRPTKEKLMTALASGEAPSAYDTYILGGDPQTIIAEGYLADITDLVENWRHYDYLKENKWGLWAQFWRGGRCYGIPSYTYYGDCVVYRKDVFEKAGIFNEEGKAGPSLDWTTEDFLKISQKVADPKKEMWAFTLSGDQLIAESLFEAYGVPLVIPDPTGKYTWKSGVNLPEAKVVYDFYRKLVEQKSVLIETGAEPLGAGMDFAGGKLAMLPSNWSHAWMWRAIMSTDKLTGPSFYHIAGTPEDMGFHDSCGIAPFPKGPQGTRISTVRTDATGLNPTISKEQRKAAFDWLTWQMGGRGWELQNDANRLLADQDQVTFVLPSTYPLPAGWLGMETLIPEWAKVHDVWDRFPVKPQPSTYDLLIMGMVDQLVPLIERIISDPKADFQKIADSEANRLNKGVLNYKVEGQTVENYKEYYTALDTFYKENFPEYYEKTFKKLYEKYYQVW